MPELPNLLRQRLAGIENGGAPVHPDADVLTAYMEESLPSAERQTVIAHLSMCEPCREVLVLCQSLLAEPATQAVLTPAPVPSWRRLFTPAFTAAASLAGIAIIAVVVLQLPQRHSQQSLNRQTVNQSPQETQQAQATPLGDEAAPSKAQETLPAPAVTGSAQVSTNPVVAAKVADKNREELSMATATVAVAPAASVTAAPPDSPAKMAVLTAGLQKKDYVNTNFFTSSSADNVVLDSHGNSFPSAPQPQPSGSTFSTGSSKMTIFADIPANAAGKSNARMLTPVQPQEHSGFLLGKIVQSTVRTLHFHSPIGTPAFHAGSLSSSALGGPGMFGGTIEKSQSIEVSAAPERADADSFTSSGSLSPGALSASGSRFNDSASPMWKVAGGKLMKFGVQSQWEDAYPVASATVEFSVVNARGNDIWAGGSHVFIIHSRDGGVTWETVKLGDNSSGTIVSIIAGTMSAQVKTSDNQTWSTIDGGKTWTLRGE
jgi:hypothetical protein